MDRWNSILDKVQSSARPFVTDIHKELNNIHKEINRHWHGEDEQEQEDFTLFDELEDESGIGRLPADLKYCVASFLSSRDLVRLSQVSRSWRFFCDEEGQWKRVYEDEKCQWDCIQSCPTAHVSTKPRKDTFVLNYLANAPPPKKSVMSLNDDTTEEEDGEPREGAASEREERQRQRERRGDNEGIVQGMTDLLVSGRASITNAIRTNTGAIRANTPALVNKLASKIKAPFLKTHRIPMLGEGLESASKDILYSMMWPQNSSMFNVTCLYPGVEGFGSGVGFCVDDVNLNIAALHRCPLDDLRINSRGYFKMADGVIYVVSCKSLPNVERRQLKLILGGASPLAPSGIPLLVLLVCEDIRSVTIRPSELADQLRLNNLDRPWCVQTVEISTLKGMPEGLRWLASKV